MKHAGTRLVLGVFQVNFPSHVERNQDRNTKYTPDMLKLYSISVLPDLNPRITLLVQATKYCVFPENMT